jgi:hypothetical protein
MWYVVSRTFVSSSQSRVVAGRVTLVMQGMGDALLAARSAFDISNDMTTSHNSSRVM